MRVAKIKEGFKFPVRTQFSKGDCRKCPLAKYEQRVTTRGGAHMYYNVYCPFGVDKTNCPIEVESEES